MTYLEIGTDQDKRTIAGILVVNGYTVRIATVKAGNRNKRVLAFEKQEERKKDE